MFPADFVTRRGLRTPGALVLPALLLLWLAAPAAAQQKQLTLDDLYDPDTKIDFRGRPARGLVWLDDTSYLWPRGDEQEQTFEWLKVDAASGRTEPFFDAARMEAALAALPGVTAADARRLAHQRSYTMNEARTALVLTIADDLYYYRFGDDEARRLTSTPGTEEEFTFSPDGRLVAFVREHDLHVVDVEGGRESRLTTDGSAERLNGKLDWVYQEEIYGRGRFRAYWWSPDSSRLAYLQLDERPVPEFTVVDHIPYRLEIETWDYPKAGDPNPNARLGIVRVAGGPTTWMDLDEYAPVQFLVVNVGWAPDGAVVFQIQDREQTWLDLRLGDAATGESRRVLRETTKAWVNENGNPEWLSDGSFLWFSERTGWKHLYHYTPDGTLVRQVTDGPWEVRRLHGVDEAAGWIYFSGTERSHIGLDVYRVKPDGTALTRLSEAAGTHSANFSPSFVQYLDTWSDVSQPPQVRLHRAADGSEVRLVDENRVAALDEYRLSAPEFLQVETRDGFVMEAVMIKPPDFDPARRYPVYQHTYGGPHAPQVRNAWGGTTYLYHQLLAQHGIIVWICDNRTASGKGVVSTWPVYQNFGELELRDIEDGLAWLRQQPYVDPSRIAINGWSYGGFMVSYALTHSRSFVAGIAGGSVTDWRDYDTIYTERYMRMPQNNPEGYRKSSPRFAAADLHGALLLMHGTIDDNVHMQNTLQFAYELQQAGKPFELMLYPKSRHGIGDPGQLKHLRATMLAFLLRHLRPDGAPGTATAGR